MNFGLRKPVLGSLALVCLAGTALIHGQATPQQARPQATAVTGEQKPLLAEEAFKNIQVLRGIPVRQFMETMGFFSASVGESCEFCHGGSDSGWDKYAEDNDIKQTARKMVLMMNAINKANFNGKREVTCYSCHRGGDRPVVTPDLTALYGTPPPAPPPDVVEAAPDAPAVDQILDKYIQALGGADALSKITSYAGTGTSTTFGTDRTNKAEIFAKAPDKYVTIVHQREGDMIRTYDGHDAWVVLPLTVTGEYQLTSTAAEGGKLDGQLAFPGNIKTFFNTWKVSFPANIDGKDVNVVQGTGPGGFLATFYFDKQTGLLTRMIRYANSAVGRVPTQIDYSDYRPVAGVMMPFKWTFGWVSGREEYEVTDYQPNAAVDAKKFAQPVQRPK